MWLRDWNFREQALHYEKKNMLRSQTDLLKNKQSERKSFNEVGILSRQLELNK